MVFRRIKGDIVMSEHEEQKVVKDGLQCGESDMEFLKNLLESALISPLGAECCHLEDFAE